MKKLIINFALFAAFTLANTTTFATPTYEITTNASEVCMEEEIVALRAGTIVSLQSNEELDSDDVYVGNSIDFFVRSNVVVNGKVVIASGSIAEGQVKKVKSSCGGNCAEITVIVDNVQTVDGQRIYLRSIPHKIKAQCCDDCGKFKVGGTPVTLQIGANISARILNDVNINA